MERRESGALLCPSVIARVTILLDGFLDLFSRVSAFSFFFFKNHRDKIDITRVSIITMLSVQFGDTRHIHMAVQPPPPSVSGTVSSSPPEALSPGNTDSPASSLRLLQPPLYLLLLSSTPPGTSYAWNHTAFVLLCLACFTEHCGLRLHPCHRCRNFLPF